MRSQIVWCAFLTFGAPWAAACDMQYFDVEIPIELQFANEQFRQDWIYRSLQPALDVPGMYVAGPTNAQVENGSLHMEFCAKGTVDEKVILNLRVASGALKLAPRPIEWRVEGERRVGRMTTVRVLDRPDPDWVVIRSVRLLPEVDGNAALLEVVVVNFGSFESSHDQLILEGKRRTNERCLSNRPMYQETILNLSQTDEASKDGESWTLLSDRKINVPVTITRSCGRATFNAEVPIQTLVPPRQTTRIVLRLREPEEELQSSVPNTLLDSRPIASSTDASRWWSGWSDISAGIKSSEAYPTSVSLKGEAANPPRETRSPLFRPR